MLSGLVVAGSLSGVLPRVPGLMLALIWWDPLVATPFLGSLVLSAAWRSRRPPIQAAIATFHRTLASELRAGLSLRLALAAACQAAPELGLARVARLAVSGRPLAEVATVLGTKALLRPAAAALQVAAMTGGSVASIFDALTAEAVDDQALTVERRSLTVQARLSVAIVGGFPFLVLAIQLSNGELARLIAIGPVGVGMVSVGVTLLVGGLLSVALLLRRARR